LRWLAAGLGVLAAVWLVALYLAAWAKRARDLLTAGAAVAGFQVGKIFYPPNQGDVAGEGRLVYIKPTMSEDLHESEDLPEYARNHLTFPQETTSDQFFDEGQFESYRELGYQLTKVGFAALGPRWLR
jgi:hypothetical protein